MQWMDVRTRIIYWAQRHKTLYFIIIMVPYLISISIPLYSKFVNKDVYFLSFLIFQACGLTWMFLTLFLGRSIDKADSLSGYYDNKCNIYQYYQNKWLRRGENQFIYITAKDFPSIMVYSFTPKPFIDLGIKTKKIYAHDTHWGTWSVSSSRPANKKEIEEYELEKKFVKVKLKE